MIDATAAPSVQELAERHAEAVRRIDELREREREISAEIGNIMADGGDPTALRDERRAVREEHEDLHAVLPHLEARLEEAKKVEAVRVVGEAVARSQEIRARATEMVRHVVPSLRAALEAAEAVEKMHHTEYTFARARAAKSAERAGQRPPSRDFILNGVRKDDFQTLRKAIKEAVAAIPGGMEANS